MEELENEMNVPDNENVTECNESRFDDIVCGLHSVLYRRIGNLKITDPRIRDAFSLFLKNVECRNTFSICEIIDSVEWLKNKGQPDEAAGNCIYCIDANIPIPAYNAKFIKSSLLSVYSLFALHNGVLLDVTAVGGSLEAAESKRFFVMSEKKMNKLFAQMGEHRPIKCGELIASNKIIFTNGKETVASLDKSLIDNKSTPCSVELTEKHYSQFLSAYRSVCSLVMCNNVEPGNILRFGLGGDIADCCARALGYFVARLNLSSPWHLLQFCALNNASVAVSRPDIKEGDYIYLLKLRQDNNSIPERPHFLQLCYYLTEKSRRGIIKNVLPVKENIQSVISRLGGNDLEYVSLADVPTDVYGIIVSVPRGESVNGIQLGYFKDI